jgi:hypothetical protein
MVVKHLDVGCQLTCSAMLCPTTAGLQATGYEPVPVQVPGGLIQEQQERAGQELLSYAHALALTTCASHVIHPCDWFSEANKLEDWLHFANSKRWHTSTALWRS